MPRNLLRPLLLAAGLLAFGACGDNRGTAPGDAAAAIDAATPIDAGPDAAPASLAPCLDRPTDLPRPTTGLPCELLPPGLVLH
ncbi:MAG TPA: hypothetical protein VHE35_30575 [Kofleriaceae bacterium]|nr:hypothetical protein [Kofleriaceae bacterium]